MMNAQLVGMSFAITPHQAAYLPLAHIYPGAPDQLDREHVLNKAQALAGERAAPKARAEPQIRHAYLCQSRHRSLRAYTTTRCCNPTCWRATSRMTWTTLRCGILNVKTISFSDVAGKGAKQIGFDQVDIATATHYAAEDADITLQLHLNLAPQIEAQKGLHHVYRDIEMPTMRRAVRHGTQRRAARQRAAAGPEPRAGRKTDRAGSQGP